MYSCTKQDINAAFKDSVQEKYCFNDIEEYNNEIIILDKNILTWRLLSEQCAERVIKEEI